MKIGIEYGTGEIGIEVPDKNLVAVLAARAAEPLEDVGGALRSALTQPLGAAALRELAHGAKSACIVVADHTRPAVCAALLPEILAQLHSEGLGPPQVLILVATGMHRASTAQEIQEIVGKPVAQTYTIENHDGRDKSAHISVGRTPGGIEGWVDRRLVEADLKIVVGLVEPHFMAGYSGARKLVCPGVTAFETLRYFHGPDLMRHPRSRTAVLDANPVHEMALAVARLTGVDLAVNVAIDSDRRIVALSAGELDASHRAVIERVDRMLKFTLDEGADIVVTGGGGAPLDRTFYQSVKGICAGADVAKAGGLEICAASCAEGIGSEEYTKLMLDSATIEDFESRLHRGGHFTLDQWQLQKHAQAASRVRIEFYTDGLPAAMLARLHVIPVQSIQGALDAALAENAGASVVILPQGPYVIGDVSAL